MRCASRASAVRFCAGREALRLHLVLRTECGSSSSSQKTWRIGWKACGCCRSDGTSERNIGFSKSGCCRWATSIDGAESANPRWRRRCPGRSGGAAQPRETHRGHRGQHRSTLGFQSLLTISSDEKMNSCARRGNEGHRELCKRRPGPAEFANSEGVLAYLAWDDGAAGSRLWAFADSR